MTRLACAVIFALAGGQLASFAARVPAIQERAGLSAGALGLAFLALEAGAPLGPPLGGAPCARLRHRGFARCGGLGSRASLRLGLLGWRAGLAAIPLAPFLALPVCALGTSVVDVA